MTDSKSLPDLPNKKNKTNWVEKRGGLPSYINRIAKHLHTEKGMDTSHAIATAVNTVKKWCSGGTVSSTKGPEKSQHVTAATKAKACAAVAEWNAMKGTAGMNAAQDRTAYSDEEYAMVLAQEMEADLKLAQDLEEDPEFDMDAYELALSAERADSGLDPDTGKALELAIFDESRHRRDLLGMFRKMSTPDLIRVKNDKTRPKLDREVAETEVENRQMEPNSVEEDSSPKEIGFEPGYDSADEFAKTVDPNKWYIGEADQTTYSWQEFDSQEAADAYIEESKKRNNGIWHGGSPESGDAVIDYVSEHLNSDDSDEEDIDVDKVNEDIRQYWRDHRDSEFNPYGQGVSPDDYVDPDNDGDSGVDTDNDGDGSLDMRSAKASTGSDYTIKQAKPRELAEQIKAMGKKEALVVAEDVMVERHDDSYTFSYWDDEDNIWIYESSAKTPNELIVNMHIEGMWPG